MQTPASARFPKRHDGARARLVALDVVRGVAVLAILAANIIGMGQPMAAYGWPGGFLSPPGPLADWLWGMQLVFVDGKFRGVFTLLFGAGMVLLQRQAQLRGQGNLLARRLVWLALFGLAHWTLLWRGDILLAYALAGLVALPFIAWPPRKRFALGLAAYLAGAVMLLAIVTVLTSIDPAGWRELAAEDAMDGATEAAVMASGDYAAWVAHSLRDHLIDLPVGVLWATFETLPLMLIGMSLVSAGIFDGRADPRRQLRWGFALWLAGTAATAMTAGSALRGGISYADSFEAPAWAALPAIASSLGLMALLALWGRTASGWMARRLGLAGRCAFTNYIGTSALALLVFSGWGLGLFGKLGRLELYALLPLFWAVMLAWPVWWLARFRHGPLEWAWRCLTYWRRLPLRH